MAPEALMGELGSEAERGLLAALLMEQREWIDVQIQVTDLQKRYDIRRRKQRIRELSLALAQAQAKGDPAQAGLEAELRRMQDEGQAVWNMNTGR
jgi:hypothetical protein